MSYEVVPSKNDFLLFTVMNLAGYNDNNGILDMHPLRIKTREHYSGKINNEIILKFYNEWEKEQPNDMAHPPYGLPEELQRIEHRLERSDKGLANTFLELLQKFRESTDFDSFYDGEVLPEYEKICGSVKRNIEEADLFKVLNDAWEMVPDFSYKIIPRPLEACWRGYGPMIDGTAFSFFGPAVKDGKVDFECRRNLSLLSHEASHPYMRVVWDGIENRAKERGMAKELDTFVTKQKAWVYWGKTALQETIMRAMQARYINPKIGNSDKCPEVRLIEEHERGFKHIFKADIAIRTHKDTPKGSLAEDLFDYLERVNFEE